MATIVSPVAGTRTEPVDSYQFTRGTVVTFKNTYTSDGVPTLVDSNTVPYIKVYQPKFLTDNTAPIPGIVTTVAGTQVPGQQYEYQFVWEIPANIIPSDEYVVTYTGKLGGMTIDFGDEFFTIGATAGMTGLKVAYYATVDDIRQKKFNIDDMLPKIYATDLIARNNLITAHLRDATTKLREELNLAAQRGNTENYRLFCIYYTIYTLLLAARGEDGSSVSDQNLIFWRSEADKILAQEKRKHANFQGLPLGRG
jgi:hypothetical protein